MGQDRGVMFSFNECRGGRRMKQSYTFAIVIKNNEIVQVGNSVIYQPKTKLVKGEIKWFDDSKLVKSRG